ncbi:GAF domain-containing protein [Pseudocolwellia agarivorans]|uniref:GAF domain-containing protein n=1 Tax=Pseudocolwellia agarivorans TaxID=1911682 RepID=UPI000985DF77|nr:GAF domain-containing protein [Pseudocolwellia agarivorans]
MEKNVQLISLEKEQVSLTLSHFTLEIVKANSDKEIFSLLADYLPLILPAERCSITLLTPDEKQLEIYALNGSDGALSIGKFLPLSNSFAGDSILENKTLWHSNYKNSLKVDAQQLYSQNIKSIMNAPIKYEHSVIGTVNIGSLSENVYNSDSAELMSLVAKLVSSYLERQDLLVQAEKGVERYKSYSLELEELARVAQILSGAMNEKEVFSIITESVSKIVSAQRISYVVFNEETQLFDVQVIFPNAVGDFSINFPLKNTALGKVYKSGEAYFFEDFSVYNYIDIKILETIGLKSSWTSPVKINGKIVGLLNAASVSIVEDGYKKLSVLNMLSGILGVTLARVKLQGKIEHQAAYDELTGLPNRNQLNVFMEKAVAISQKTPFTVLYY